MDELMERILTNPLLLPDYFFPVLERFSSLILDSGVVNPLREMPKSKILEEYNDILDTFSIPLVEFYKQSSPETFEEFLYKAHEYIISIEYAYGLYDLYEKFRDIFPTSEK